MSDESNKPDWIKRIEDMEREAGIQPDNDPNPIVFHVRDYPPYSFGFEYYKAGTYLPTHEVQPCSDPRGHLWEEGSTVLLSYPRQHPLTCVHCGETTTRTEPIPQPKRYTDAELKRMQGK